MLTVFAMMTTALFAWAFGRKVIFWSLTAYFFTFWPVLVLCLLRKKQPRLPKFPKILLAFYGQKYVAKTIEQMEREF